LVDTYSNYEFDSKYIVKNRGVYILSKRLYIAIEISDLLEATGQENSYVAFLFDSHIIPFIKDPLYETDIIGLGKRFSNIIDKVRNKVKSMGSDSIKSLKNIMKLSLIKYIKATNDVQTGRELFHRAIMSGGEIMLTVTGAALLANVLASQHNGQAKSLMKSVLNKLNGKQVDENASSSATGSSSIATTVLRNKKNKDKDSIFAENITLEDLEEKPLIMERTCLSG
jgi:hypothetical protein